MQIKHKKIDTDSTRSTQAPQLWSHVFSEEIKVENAVFDTREQIARKKPIKMLTEIGSATRVSGCLGDFFIVAKKFKIVFELVFVLKCNMIFH